MMLKKYLFIINIFFIVSCAHHLPDFTSRLSVRTPTDGGSRAIGEYALGCLQGAQTFTGKEKGILISQMKRGRYWGHPDLIHLLTRAGAEFDKSHQTLILGDLSQSRGGPMITGHNSHQIGLDVDVWLKILAQNNGLSFRAAETEEMKPINEPGEDQIKLIKFFADDTSVERIFINPSFKKKLCQDLKLTALEQHKLRAWWGHDDHIHVRLKCPSDSPSCISQKPIPEGDGCGKELDWWFTEEAKNSEDDESYEGMKKAYLEKIAKLPKECSFYHETF
jgi:penicillin-insensitive murein endopeptidase